MTWPPLDDRSTAAADFYEWLLSDHPWAAAERQRRRTSHLKRELAETDEVLAITARVRQAPAAGEHVHRLAQTVEPLARRAALAAEICALVDDATYVAIARQRLETSRRVAGDSDYRYPTQLTGPQPAGIPPPDSSGRTGWT